MGIQQLFLGNTGAHLAALMSGLTSLCIAVWQAYKKHPKAAQQLQHLEAYSADVHGSDGHRPSRSSSGYIRYILR